MCIGKLILLATKTKRYSIKITEDATPIHFPGPQDTKTPPHGSATHSWSIPFPTKSHGFRLGGANVRPNPFKFSCKTQASWRSWLVEAKRPTGLAKSREEILRYTVLHPPSISDSRQPCVQHAPGHIWNIHLIHNLPFYVLYKSSTDEHSLTVGVLALLTRFLFWIQQKEHIWGKETQGQLFPFITPANTITSNTNVQLVLLAVLVDIKHMVVVFKKKTKNTANATIYDGQQTV